MTNRTLTTCLIVAISTLTLPGLRFLELNSDPQFIVSDLERKDPRFAKWKDAFGGSQQLCLVMLKSDDCLTPETLAVIKQLADDLRAQESVQAVSSLLDVRGKRKAGRYILPLIPSSLDADKIAERHDEIVNHPLIQGRLLSHDRQATLIGVDFDPRDKSMVELRTAVDGISAIVARHAAAEGVEAGITGIPPIQIEVDREMRADQLKFNLIGTTLASLLAWMIFRSVRSAVAVGIGPIIGVLWTLGLMGWLGLNINILNSVLPLMVMVVGYTDSVHLMLRMKRNIGSGMEPRVAVAEAVRVLWLPCLATSLTTAASFGSLCISEIQVLREFSLFGAVGCLVNFVAVIIILPLCVLSPLGRHLAKAGDTGWAWLDRFCTGLASLVNRWAGPLATVGIMLMLASVALCFQLRADDRLSHSMPKHHRTYQWLQQIEAAFGGGMPLQLMIEWPESMSVGSPSVVEIMREVERVVEEHPLTSNPVSILDWIETLPGGSRSLSLIPKEKIDPIFRADLRAALVTASVPDSGTAMVTQAIDEIEAAFEPILEHSPGVSVRFSGPGAATCRVFRQLMRDLGKSLLLAGGIIFATLLVVTRNLTLALVGVIPNVFALAGAGALITLSGEPFQYVSVVALTICLGVAVDDTIHCIMAYQRFRTQPGMHDDAIGHAITEVAPPIFMTTLVFLVGFGTVFSSKIPTLRTFSWLSCSSLGLAVIADLLLLPALLIMVRRWRK